MIEFQAKVKKWGGSYAIVIPNDIVEKAGLKVGTKITLWIVKDSNLMSSGGMLKNMENIPTKQIIKEVKKGWYKNRKRKDL